MNLDTRTWIILALLVAGLTLILATPGLRQNVATWLVWLATLIGGGAREYERQHSKPPTADDNSDGSITPGVYQRPPLDEPDDDPATPEAGDGQVDTEYWEGLEE